MTYNERFNELVGEAIAELTKKLNETPNKELFKATPNLIQLPLVRIENCGGEGWQYYVGKVKIGKDGELMFGCYPDPDNDEYYEDEDDEEEEFDADPEARMEWFHRYNVMIDTDLLDVVDTFLEC